MQQKNLKIFFTDKIFVVPPYQRDYAWLPKNVDDLFEDIEEAIESSTGHFLGTFILSTGDENKIFKVVDGQQRLTTLTMLMHVLIESLSNEQVTEKIISKNHFVFSDKSGYRLELLGKNKEFFRKLLSSQNPSPENKSQKRLLAAHEHMLAKVHSLKEHGGDGKLLQWLECIQSLDVLEFIESDEGRAIRIFGTVNDRGVSLTNMEKAKSLLIYYSNRFVDGGLDSKISNAFGNAFNDYNVVKEVAEDPRVSIQLIKDVRFNEDSIMRYHFLSYDNDYYDYTASSDYILDGFLKNGLKGRRFEREKLKGFIESYTDDLETFFVGISALLDTATKDIKYYKLFTFMNLSAFLYPLVVRLNLRGLLDCPVPNSSIVGMTFLDLIEITDIRVYKIRGTDPSRDVAYLAKDAATMTPEEIANRLLYINKRFMSDAELVSYLEKDMYKNRSLPHVFIEYNETLRESLGLQRYTLDELKDINVDTPTIEHIFPQSPSFAFPSRGFFSEEEYFSKNDKIGNLTLLLQSLNSKCQNKTVDQKISDHTLYSSCGFASTKKLISSIHHNGGFESGDIDTRTAELISFIKKRWPIWS